MGARDPQAPQLNQTGQSMTDIHSLATAVTDLEIGMYVTALDRPWIETPFLVEGFYIASQSDIDELERHCKYVYVDTTRSRVGMARRDSRVVGAVAPRPKMAPGHSPEPSAESLQFRPASANAGALLFPHRKLKPYDDLSSFVEEMPAARESFASLFGAYEQIARCYRDTGRLELTGLRDIVNPVVESMIRNPDACVWLARCKNADRYASGHSVSTVVWALALGRQMGLPRVELQRLALGALLFDIGKLRVPQELLQKQGRLSKDEFLLIKSHVQFGLEMLQGSGLMNRTVADMAEFHHERHAGHGYPHGLKGDAIPVYGRIAAIVDCYDAITSRRSYAAPMSPGNAVKKFYAWRDVDFQSELVEAFIQALGVYPAGSLVELSSGEVGVVLCGYRTRRLRPQLLMLLGRDKTPLAVRHQLDLAVSMRDETGAALEIVSSLEPGAYGIEPDDIDLQ
jgi:HD-GYP domain-containing protein (c-di-GMP phosphodiesterase class II)